MEKSTGAVQQKLSCLFQVAVKQGSSSKRSNQSYNVIATEVLHKDALSHDIFNAFPTEKVDGTCVYFETFQGKPWLWARYDRKATKLAERRFRKHLSTNQHLPRADTLARFIWNIDRDFKVTPEHWVPALGVCIIDGVPQPDDHGHIPGWVPVMPTSPQHMWHNSVADLTLGSAVVLREGENGGLNIKCERLSDLIGCTGELIGTNVNANPYKLGSKREPIHTLYIHGSFRLSCPPLPDLAAIRDWFEFGRDSQVEGIVWHCGDGHLYKLHRHHLGLPWPVNTPRLSSLTTVIDFSSVGPLQDRSIIGEPLEMGTARVGCNMLQYFCGLNGRMFESLSSIHALDT